MTRINTIDPVLLVDQHLMAEYREITRISALSKVCDIPSQYVLGTGHCKFFYDKGIFLFNRRLSIYRELLKRKFNVNWYEYTLHACGLNLDWNPTSQDHIINLQRLDEKVKQKPGFYKFHSVVVTDDFYSRQLVDLN